MTKYEIAQPIGPMRDQTADLKSKLQQIRETCIQNTRARSIPSRSNNMSPDMTPLIKLKLRQIRDDCIRNTRARMMKLEEDNIRETSKRMDSSQIDTQKLTVLPTIPKQKKKEGKIKQVLGRLFSRFHMFK